MLSKTQFKEWFDSKDYRLRNLQLRINWGDKQPQLQFIDIYFLPSNCKRIVAWRIGNQKKRQNIQQKDFKDVLLIIKTYYWVWLSCGIDILFIRPFCMYWLPILTGNALTGIIFGKFVWCGFLFLTIVNEWMKSTF
jgi:hypothetical protein